MNFLNRNHQIIFPWLFSSLVMFVAGLIIMLICSITISWSLLAIQIPFFTVIGLILALIYDLKARKEQAKDAKRFRIPPKY